jgi:hypothetical protein
MTAFELINTFDCFEPVRDEKLEEGIKKLIESTEKPHCLLKVDSADAFNYETAADGKYDVTELKNMLSQEIIKIKQWK